MLRTFTLPVLLSLLFVCGCEKSPDRLEPVPFDKLPPGSMEAAAKALPGVKFERARKAHYNDKETFEIIGKEKNGKTREVEVSTTGQIVEIE
jgi:hypothetical protein